MKNVILIILMLLAQSVHSSEWKSNTKISEVFLSNGVTGTIVVYDVKRDEFIYHNLSRAKTPFSPASTFKVANSLIGLAVAAVKDTNEVLPYGGKPQHFKSWEKDASLKEAIKLSSVPIYQELARRIGLERMQNNINKLQYGNRTIGIEIENFWLNGDLQISAEEQVRFLSKLALGTLPFSSGAQKEVRDIALIEKQSSWELYGKTGWSNITTPNIGWWVGWIKNNESIYSFALNIDVASKSDARKRVKVGKESLQVLGVL